MASAEPFRNAYCSAADCPAARRALKNCAKAQFFSEPCYGFSG
jgi:hypothetical protein